MKSREHLGGPPAKGHPGRWESSGPGPKRPWSCRDGTLPPGRAARPGGARGGEPGNDSPGNSPANSRPDCPVRFPGSIPRFDSPGSKSPVPRGEISRPATHNDRTGSPRLVPTDRPNALPRHRPRDLEQGLSLGSGYRLNYQPLAIRYKKRIRIADFPQFSSIACRQGQQLESGTDHVERIPAVLRKRGIPRSALR